MCLLVRYNLVDGLARPRALSGQSSVYIKVSQFDPKSNDSGLQQNIHLSSQVMPGGPGGVSHACQT